MRRGALGEINSGKLADKIALSDNPLETDADRLHEIAALRVASQEK